MQELIPSQEPRGQDLPVPQGPPDTSGGLNPHSWGVYAAMAADPNDPYGLSLWDPRQYGDFDQHASYEFGEQANSCSAHRPKYPKIRFPENLGVARPVGRKEIQSTPLAEASLVTEWDRLRSIRTWEEKEVQEWSDVRKKLGPGVINHVGRIF